MATKKISAKEHDEVTTRLNNRHKEDLAVNALYIERIRRTLIDKLKDLALTVETPSELMQASQIFSLLTADRCSLSQTQNVQVAPGVKLTRQ